MIVRYCLFIAFLGVSLFSEAQNIDRIQQALTKGDAEVLSVHFDDMVEFCVNEDEYFLSKDEAKAKVKVFFQNNPVTGFNLVHKGASANKGSKYLIGSLLTEKMKYRAYIYLEDDDGKPLIQELRFDTEK